MSNNVIQCVAYENPFRLLVEKGSDLFDYLQERTKGQIDEPYVENGIEKYRYIAIELCDKDIQFSIGSIQFSCALSGQAHIASIPIAGTGHNLEDCMNNMIPVSYIIYPVY